VVIGLGSKQLPSLSTDIARDSNGYVYILNLKTGELVKKINLGHTAIVGDILAIDKDKDYLSEKIYFGTSYKDTTWKGKLMSLSIPADVTTICGSNSSTITLDYAACTSGTNPPLRTLFADNYPFTASPDAAKDSYGNTWVYAGSGKYYSDVDESDTVDQIFFGLKDSGSTIAKSIMADKTSVQTTGTVSETAQVCGYNSASGSFGLQTVVTSITPTSTTPPPSTYGWYILLNSGERVITRPLSVGGVVDFLTYKPSSDLCSYGGDSYMYAWDNHRCSTQQCSYRAAE
jgi:type IV pilus assembly protein PilY1